MKVKNKQVVFLSIIALICVVLAFIVDWIFLAPAVIIMLINQRKLMKKEPNSQEKSKKEFFI